MTIHIKTYKDLDGWVNQETCVCDKDGNHWVEVTS